MHAAASAEPNRLRWQAEKPALENRLISHRPYWRSCMRCKQLRRHTIKTVISCIPGKSGGLVRKVITTVSDVHGEL